MINIRPPTVYFYKISSRPVYVPTNRLFFILRIRPPLNFKEKKKKNRKTIAFYFTKSFVNVKEKA